MRGDAYPAPLMLNDRKFAVGAQAQRCAVHSLFDSTPKPGISGPEVKITHITALS